MSDAFRNYNNLISGLNSADQFKDSGIRAVAETKSKADEMGKTIGEVKSFLSGQHGGRAFAKDIKPILKKRAERLAQRAKTELENRVKGIKQSVETKLQQARQDAQSRLEQAQQRVSDRLNGEPPASQDAPNTQGENPTQRPVEDENEEPAPEETGTANDGYDDWDTPYQEGDDAFDDWDTPWGGDTIAESRAGTFSNPIGNLRNSFTNPAQADSQSQPPSYDDSVSDTTTTKAGDPDDMPNMDAPPPKFNAPETNQVTGNGAATDSFTQEELDKQLADKMAKEAAEKAIASSTEKTVATTGAEEGGLSILDAVPGLDVLGFIGGGILAAIEARKQKKEEGIEEEGAGSTPNQAVQIGVGGE